MAGLKKSVSLATKTRTYLRIDEQIKIEQEEIEKKKKIDMSKNLIDILFKKDNYQKRYGINKQDSSV